MNIFSLTYIRICTITIFLLPLNLAGQHIIALSEYKEGLNRSLTSACYKELQQCFGVEIFIETGTYHGGSTKPAIPLFKEVHTIELNRDLYDMVSTMFKPYSHVVTHWGDSGKLLPAIFKKTKGRILFWLDGHVGDASTPLLYELQAIKEAGITDSVILIDDIRDCRPPAWPSLRQVVESVYAINTQYTVVICGDILLAYPQNDNVAVSPLLQACSQSRLFEEGYTQGTPEDLIKKEMNDIGGAQGIERDTIKKLGNVCTEDPHYMLWYGLVEYADKNYAHAMDLFKRAMETPRGIKHWRILIYYARAAHEAGNTVLAKQCVQRIMHTQNVPSYAYNYLNARQLRY